MLSGGLRTGLIDFTASRNGVSAVEFSLIAPILLLMFMASIELPRAYMIGKRLDNATATMADLISRGNYTDLSPVFAALEAIANPYDVSRASIVLTAGARTRPRAALRPRRRSVRVLNPMVRPAWPDRPSAFRRPAWTGPATVS
ncbi:TadE/TadG family type IV pilus assembly protein [Methylobacterium tardum]|uniref:TadE/TadG family type IV pilus assembly protein n=1 Tax=Methylobacterium tardum TaxID=374432 RepID=UPI00360CD4BB